VQLVSGILRQPRNATQRNATQSSIRRHICFLRLQDVEAVRYEKSNSLRHLLTVRKSYICEGIAIVNRLRHARIELARTATVSREES